MPLKFVFGPSGSGKSTYLYQHVIEESERNPQENSIFGVLLDATVGKGGLESDPAKDRREL